jgi:hypothetical protein
LLTTTLGQFQTIASTTTTLPYYVISLVGGSPLDSTQNYVSQVCALAPSMYIHIGSRHWEERREEERGKREENLILKNIYKILKNIYYSISWFKAHKL